MQRLKRHHLWVALGVVLAVVAAVLVMDSATPPSGKADVVLYKHPQCGCCGAWADHMRANGFDVETRAETDAEKRWAEHGVPPRLGSCHSAEVDGYIVEGHVPAEDIRRLLEERPDAKGLVVPGMPVGSPGMEGPNPEPYEVLLLKKDNSTQVWARHTP